MPTLEALRNGAVVQLDTTRTRVAITGGDREMWLNGVLTCDVLALAKHAGPSSSYGCALTVKGRIVTDVVVVRDADRIGAWVAAARGAEVVETWDKHIVMEDCELALDESRALIWLQGSRAAEIAKQANVIGAALDDLGLSGFVFDLPRDEATAALARMIEAGAVEVDANSMHALRVEAGRATFGADFDDHAYVQEAGLTDRAVSFSKGCYLGQEVVCMAQNRGKVHRKLVKLVLDGNANVGEDVSADGAVVGKLTSVVPRDDGKALALAMIKTNAADPGKVLAIGSTKAEVVAAAR